MVLMLICNLSVNVRSVIYGHNIREQIMQLRDIVIYANRHSLNAREFNFEGQCVAFHYLINLHNVEAGRFVKAVVELIGDGSLETTVFEDCVNVAINKRAFDFDGYWKLDRQQKKERILVELHSGLLALAERYCWGRQEFEQAYQKVLSEKIKLVRTWNKPKLNKSRTMKAQLIYDFDIDGIQVVISVRNMQEIELTRSVVANLPPFDYLLTPMLGKIKWETDSIVVLLSKDGRERWEVVLGS